jgi:mannose-6-phosphate isomerase-like protein (cupin superfamily)
MASIRYHACMENRRNALRLLAMAATAGSPLLAEGGQHLRDQVVGESKAKLSRNPFGDTRVFFDGATSQLKSMVAGSLLLKPGMEPHPPHQHPEEEIMIVTAGSGEILVGRKNVTVGPGSMMYCEANQLHGVKNTGSEPLLFYYCKWMA